MGIFDKYSKKEGLKKTIKNVLVTYIAPAILYIANSYQQYVPNEYLAIAAPFVAGITYFTKNWIENRD